MDNKDRLIKIVAQKTGLTQKQVKAVVASQALFIKETMRSKAKKSVYLRKVGTFIPRDIKKDLTVLKIENRKIRNNNKGTSEDLDKNEDPLTFD